MLYSSFRRVKISKTIIFVLLLTFWLYSTTISQAVVTADWGDVVDVHYFRFTNPDYTGVAEDNEIDYIYLAQGSNVPADIKALFPDASAGYFSEFKAGIIGLAIDESKQFTAIEQGTAYYFEVTLLRIQYDAVVDDPTSTEETTTTTTTTEENDPLGDLGNLVLFGSGGVIIAGSILTWAVVTSRRRGRALSSDVTSASRREESIKHSKTKLKELRELAESRGTESPDKSAEETSDIKFRRRR